MICRSSLLGFCLRREVLFVALILLIRSDECTSVNDEGLALLKFRLKVDVDPHGAFKNWGHKHGYPCSWKGVRCIDGKVQTVIQQNSLQQLKKANSFVVPIKGEVLHFLVKLSWLRFKQFLLPHGSGQNHGVIIQSFPEPYIEQSMQLDMSSARRKLLQDYSNHPAVPVSGSPSQEAVTVPSTGSGAFPAVPNSNGGKFHPNSGFATSPVDPNSSNLPTSEDNESSIGLVQIIVLALPAIAIIIMLTAGTILRLHQKGSAMVDDDASKTGLSGPLQKAFVTSVPKLNHTELEAACEDFSNIIVSYPFCTVYKGTLSSGVEMSVISTAVASNNWSKHSESHFRKMVDILSRINHKNFVQLLGYCEEIEPFMRMLAFEYAPNGTLYEHLHLKEFEHLDWTARMRIIMGFAYCLRYLHHELNPPVFLAELKSKSIYLTDDFAAKIYDHHMWEEIAERQSKSPDGEMEHSESLRVDPGANIYDFGILMLETISGNVSHSAEEDSIVNWATEYLNDKCKLKNLLDPSLKTYRNNELEVVCEAIQQCIHRDLKNRPNIMELAAKLKAVTGISQEAASPRGLPLWWAESEILSS